MARLHPLLRIVQISSRKTKHLWINPEEKTLVLFDISELFTNILVPVGLQVINSKISTCTSFTYSCTIPTEKFIKLLEFTITNCIFCFNKKLYKQLQGVAMGSPVFPVIANIYMEPFESLAIHLLQPSAYKFTYLSMHPSIPILCILYILMQLVIVITLHYVTVM